MAPVALYRKMDGVSVFTGFVKRGDNFFKLHDVWGDLDGDAHEATPPEFLSQMALYDGSEDKRYQKPIPTISVASKDESILHGKCLDGVDELFPFEESEKGIRAKFRADDLVLVVAVGERVCGDGCVAVTLESAWYHVISVTPCGKVTAMPTVQLKWSPIGPHEPVLFDADCVLAMKRGQHWA